jgi:hypothetical protein
MSACISPPYKSAGGGTEAVSPSAEAFWESVAAQVNCEERRLNDRPRRCGRSGTSSDGRR